MKKLLAAALLALSLPAAAQVTSTDTFVQLSGRAWLTFDPAQAFDAVSTLLVGNVYETLVTFKDSGSSEQLEPVLSLQVPTLENGLVSKDRLSYTFPIRPGVRFHDGSFMTAEDVRYSLLRFMLGDSEGGPAALLLRPILGVYSLRGPGGGQALDFKTAASAVSVDGDRVVVRLKQPDASFLKILASLPLVTAKSWAAAHGDWDGSEDGWKKIAAAAQKPGYLQDHMNGTGPFRLEKADPERGVAVLLRNDAYWRAPAALRKVVFKAVPNGGMRLFMLENGDADAAYVESSYRHYARSMKGVRVVEDLPANRLGDIFFFTFKTASEDNGLLGSGKLDGRGVPADFFSDPDLRRAFAWAFDYDSYFKKALGGKGARAKGPFPPSLLEVPGKPPFDYDPEKAAAYFKKAWGGKVWEEGFTLPVVYAADNSTRETAAEILKAGLEKINPKFKVHLRHLETRRFYQELEARRLPLYIGSYDADYPDPQSFAFGLLHSQGYGPKFQGYASAAADKLVEQAEASDDAGERRKIYLSLNQLSAADLPQFFTCAPAPFRLCRDWVEGCESRDNANNLGFNDFPYFYAYSKRRPQ